jgi:hypothetical protein
LIDAIAINGIAQYSEFSSHHQNDTTAVLYLHLRKRRDAIRRARQDSERPEDFD